MLPYMPFLDHYWPFIITGVVCFVAASILFRTVDLSKHVITESENEEDDKEEMCAGDDDERCCNLNHVPYKFQRISHEESISSSEAFYKMMDARRTVRFFSSDPVPKEVIHNIVRAAGTAPSGAHTEPWTYVVVSEPEVKQAIRQIVEDEERFNYESRMGSTWVSELKPLGTTWEKEYLTTAPHLICVFKQMNSLKEDGTRRVHYYNEISVAIATGILLCAIQSAGLVSLTSTPMNCGPALRTLFGRPSNEKLLVLLPVGYPADNATVPDLTRKSLDQILVAI